MASVQDIELKIKEIEKKQMNLEMQIRVANDSLSEVHAKLIKLITNIKNPELKSDLFKIHKSNKNEGELLAYLLEKAKDKNLIKICQELKGKFDLSNQIMESRNNQINALEQERMRLRDKLKEEIDKLEKERGNEISTTLQKR